MKSKLFSQVTLAQIKQIFLKATIILLALSAILAIIAILISSNEFTLKILGTTLLLSLFSLISTNNILRLGSEQQIVRIAAVSALIADFIWLIPWLCVLWGLMPQYNLNTSSFLTSTWDLIFTGLIIAVASTIVSNFINFYHIKDSTIQALASLTIISSIILSILWLLDIWFEPSTSYPWQLHTIFLVFFVFGLVTTPILVKIRYDNIQKEAQPSPSQEELRAQIEREVRAKIATEQAAKQTAKQAPEQTTEQKPTQPTQ